MTKTKIEWCDFSWNPVWGCLNQCIYCYAIKIAKRFWEYIARKEELYLNNTKSLRNLELREKLYNFEPVWLESNFNKPFPKKPSRIFVNSMSDIDSWHPEWMKKVLKRIEDYPQHQFIFLSKNILIYNRYKFPKHCYKGITIENSWLGFNENIDFISIEPIQEDILIDYANETILKNYKWIILGAETGNRKGKIIPKKEWIDKIANFCKEKQIPLFMKNSLFPIMNGQLIQEFPAKMGENL